MAILILDERSFFSCDKHNRLLFASSHASALREVIFIFIYFAPTYLNQTALESNIQKGIAFQNLFGLFKASKLKKLYQIRESNLLA